MKAKMLDTRHSKITHEEFVRNINIIRTLRACITPTAMVAISTILNMMMLPYPLYCCYVSLDYMVEGRRSLYGVISSVGLTTLGLLLQIAVLKAYKSINDNNFHIGSQIKGFIAIMSTNVIAWDIITISDSPPIFYGTIVVNNLCFALIPCFCVLHNLYFIKAEKDIIEKAAPSSIATMDAMKSKTMFDQATIQMTQFDNQGDKAPTIFDVISDPALRDNFAKHLEREFAIENLLFIQEIVRYKSSNGENAQLIAKTLVKDFMLPDSLNEVNLPGPLVKATVKSIETSGHRVETFDDALHHILFMLETDQLPKFLKSQIYTNYCNK